MMLDRVFHEDRTDLASAHVRASGVLN